jgi:hypothetical protein
MNQMIVSPFTLKNNTPPLYLLENEGVACHFLTKVMGWSVVF